MQKNFFWVVIAAVYYNKQHCLSASITTQIFIHAQNYIKYRNYFAIALNFLLTQSLTWKTQFYFFKDFFGGDISELDRRSTFWTSVLLRWCGWTDADLQTGSHEQIKKYLFNY